MKYILETDFDKTYDTLSKYYLTEAKTKINLKKLLANMTSEDIINFDKNTKLLADDITMDLPDTIKQEYVNYLNQFSRLHISEKAIEPEDTVYHIHHINLESLGGASELRNLIVLTAEQHQAVHNKLKELVDNYSGTEIISKIVASKIRQAAGVCSKTKNAYNKQEMSEAQSILKLNAKSSGGNEDTLQRGRLKQFKIIFDDVNKEPIIVNGYEGIAQALNMQSTSWDTLRKIIQKWFAEGKNHSDSYKKYGVKEIIRLEPKNEGEDKPLYMFNYKSDGTIDWTIDRESNYYINLSKASDIAKVNGSDIGFAAKENHDRLVDGYLPSHWVSKYNYIPVYESDIPLLINLLEKAKEK